MSTELVRRSPATLARVIERDHERLTRALAELKNATRQALAVRKRIADHAWGWLLMGLAVGMLIGGRGSRRSAERRRG